MNVVSSYEKINDLRPGGSHADTLANFLGLVLEIGNEKNSHRTLRGQLTQIVERLS